MSDNGRLTWTTEQRRLGDLREWEKNPRKLSAHDAKHIKLSLDTFGLADPLIINADNSLIGGHQRKHILADPETIVDVRVPSRQLSEREAEELAIRLNKAQGSWDWDALANGWMFDELIDWGFSEEELAGLDFGQAEPAEDPGADIDRAAELQEKWQVQTGDLWEIGAHRLICGDCTDPAVVERVMQGEKAGAVVTDPPYGLGDAKSFNDDHPDYEDGEPFDLTKLDLSIPFVVWGGQYYDWLPAARNEIGWIVWDKRPDLEGEKRERADRIFGQHFEIAITSIGDLRGKMYRQRWGGYYGSQEIYHKTQKPPELFEWCIEPTEGIVIDYFCGSGTNIIACERLGRRGRGIEISPAYCAVTLERLSQMGLEPRRVE